MNVMLEFEARKRRNMYVGLFFFKRQVIKLSWVKTRHGRHLRRRGGGERSDGHGWMGWSVF
jgi:hypothetical protein